MPENRQYAGVHDAVSIQIADGLFATVLNREVDDEHVERLGFTLDADTDPARGLIFARRTVTVSDHLARALPADEFPRVGGTADDDNVIDDPASNPVTSRAVRDAELGSDPLPTPEEAHERDMREALAGYENRLRELDVLKAERDARIEPLAAREDDDNSGEPLSASEAEELKNLRADARRDDAIRDEIEGEVSRING